MEVSQPRRAIKGLVLGLAGILGLATGCGAKAIVKPDGERLDGYEDAVQRVRANTTSFLKESLAATDGLQRFTCEFWRQERLGPLDQLRPAERIRAEYRRQPLSVRFTWLNEDS